MRATRAAALTLKTEAAIKKAKMRILKRQKKNRNRKGKRSSGDRELRKIKSSFVLTDDAQKAIVDLKNLEEKEEEETGASVLQKTLLSRTNAKMLLGIIVILFMTSFLQVVQTDRTGEAGAYLLDSVYSEGFNQALKPKPTDDTGME